MHKLIVYVFSVSGCQCCCSILTIYCWRIMVIKFSWILIIDSIRTINSSLRVFNIISRVNTNNIAGIRWRSYSKLMFSVRLRNRYDSLFLIGLRRSFSWVLLVDYVLIAIWHRVVYEETLVWITYMANCVVHIITWTLLSFESFNSHLLITVSLLLLWT